VKQRTVLAEIQCTIRKTSELILASQQLIRQLDLMNDTDWRRAGNESP
jgi:hypothetical protein